MKISELLSQIKPYVLGWIRDYQTTGQVRANNVPRFVGLQSPLTSTSWDGDSYSDAAKTLIDLSSVFGVPPGVRAVMLAVDIRDSGSAANATYIIFAPNDTANIGIGGNPPAVNDRWGSFTAIVPCDANGDIYYEIEASGATTFDVVVRVWGYWI